jgi:transcription antitermination factor NusG
MEQNVYCLFCTTGFEARTESFLKDAGFSAIPSESERVVIKNGKRVKVKRPLLPGYVLFMAANEPDWAEFAIKAFIRYPLRYSDGGKALRGADLSFVNWLMSKKGLLRVSKAVEIGARVTIIDGPLKELSGKITRVNRRQRCAEVELGSDSILNKIWLSYELIEAEPGK